MGGITERMLRAARLDAALYEEVEADPGATGQAMTVVVLASVAAGLGLWSREGISGLVVGILSALAAWFVWALLTWVIGTRVLPGARTDADLGQLLRTTGFSASPGILRIFTFIPAVGPVIAVVAAVWMLVAMIVAVRQALDYDGTGRAVAVCLIGWIVQVVFLFGALALLGVVGAVAGGGS